MLKLRWSHASCRRGAYVTSMQFALLGLLTSQASAANLTLRVSNEIAPAGGWAQIKVFAAAPAQIASGYIGIAFDPSVFGPIGNIAVFSSAGDATGIATVNSQSLSVLFNSSSAGMGQLPDLPMLTVTLPVLPNVPAGTVSAITIGTSNSELEIPNPWTDQNGNVYTVTVTPGSVTVGGSLSVQNVMPGGGLMAAGTRVRINGTGFSAATSVSIAGVSVSNPQFIGQSEIDVTLAGGADLTGKLVVLANPDGSQTQFFSAVESIPDEAAANLAYAEPLLSMQTWLSAETGFTLRGGGIALQNPNPVPVPVDVILQTQAIGNNTSQTTVTIPPGDLQVYQTSAFSFSAFASLPVRILGMEDAGIEGILPEVPVPATPALQQVTAVPAAVTFNWQVGTAIPEPASVTLVEANVSLGYSYVVALSGSMFSVTPSTASSTLTVDVNPVGLNAGTYTGSITITPPGPNAVITTIPLTLNVSPLALLYSSAASLTLTGPGDSQRFLSITSNGNPIPFTVTASSGPGPAWLSVSPSGGTTPANLTVNEASTGLSDGVYNGQISISGPNNTVTVPVQWTVNSPSLFASAPTSVTFSLQVGSAAPPAQTIAVYGDSAGVVFSASTSSGGNWLSVTKSPSAEFGAAIAVNPAGLAAGVYSGAVGAISPASAVPATIPVSLVIWNQQPALTVTPASISFATPVPEPTAQAPMQILQISSGGVPVNFTTTALTGMFTTPASIPVYAQFPFNAQGSATPGSYEYNLSITSGTQTVIVPVTTFITTGPATPPFLGSIVNAASQISGSVAPGEILTVYGFGAGPSDAAGFTLNASGSVATSLNGAQVLFDGRPAPMIYGSAYMANVIVPYEIANRATTTIALQYGGVTSAGWAVPVAASAPGIFTLAAAGLGQAAVLNQDNSVNGASNPASRGSVIQIYATGEGQTSPTGVTGSVITTDLKRPLLPVTVSIGGRDAVVQYSGSAGDAVTGLFQVNAPVPQSVTPGTAVPIVISVGGIPSQSGVTIAVQ